MLLVLKLLSYCAGIIFYSQRQAPVYKQPSAAGAVGSIVSAAPRECPFGRFLKLFPAVLGPRCLLAIIAPRPIDRFSEWKFTSLCLPGQDMEVVILLLLPDPKLSITGSSAGENIS